MSISFIEQSSELESSFLLSYVKLSDRISLWCAFRFTSLSFFPGVKAKSTEVEDVDVTGRVAGGQELRLRVVGF